jgi:hypothetical protein
MPNRPPGQKPGAPDGEGSDLPDLPADALELEVRESGIKVGHLSREQFLHEQSAGQGGDNAGYAEIDFEQQDSAPAAGGDPGTRDVEFDAEAISQEAAPPPPPAAVAPSAPAGMQASMEVTDFYAGFDASSAQGGGSEKPYTGMALDMRQLFASVEELLHERTAAKGSVSLTTQNLGDVCDRFAAGLVEMARRHRVIPLTVSAHALACQGRPVLREAGESGAGLYRLYAAGVQTLTVVDRIDLQQSQTLAKVLLSAPEVTREAATQGDVVRWFWELGLDCVRLAVLETFEEVEALPGTGIPTLEVPDQAVEQMCRLRSRLLSAVPGVARGKKQTAVRTIAISQDDLRALDRELFNHGAKLLDASARTVSVLPFPALGPLDKDVTAGLDADLAGVGNRHAEALLQTIVLLQEPERIAPLVERLVQRPQAHFQAGEIQMGIQFLQGIRAWAQTEPGRAEKEEATAAILARSSVPEVLLPLLERFNALTPSLSRLALEFIGILPAPATATLGIRVARPTPAPTLVDCFRARLDKDLPELKNNLDDLHAEQATGLLDGMLAVRDPRTAELAALLSRNRHGGARVAAARACRALDASLALPILERLADDEEASVRKMVIWAAGGHTQRSLLGRALFRSVQGPGAHHWLFPEKRAALAALVAATGEQAKQPLRQLVQRPNPYQRRSISETRAAALLALAQLGDPADEKLAGEAARSGDRKVLTEAARVLLAKPPPGRQLAPLGDRIESAMRPFDAEQDDDEETGSEDQDPVVKELSPQALKAMRIDELLQAPGDQLQILGAALFEALAGVIAMGRSGDTSSEPFVIGMGRGVNIAGALGQHLAGPVALQTFGGHFFVNAQRLRLSFDTFRKLAPITEVCQGLRIQELLFAEPPRRGDLLEVILALLAALKIEREPWLTLERNFARVRLRELSLIKESWGRPADVEMDLRANAARLFGTLYLWFDDVGRLPDRHDLLPLRAERLVREIADAREEGDALLDGLLGPKEVGADPALLAAHGVMLAAILARALRCSREQVASVVRCAMHQPLGTLGLPRPLLEDLGAENAYEAGELGRTPLYGAARIAAAEVLGQPLTLPFLAAFEGLAPLSSIEGRGPPYLTPKPPMMHARLIAVAQRYAFLTSAFSRRPALSADQAIAAMLADPRLDFRLVRALANRAGVIPAGARVRLADGRQALVVSAPLQPSVDDPLLLKILRGTDGKPTGDPLLGLPGLAITGSGAGAPAIAGVVDGEPSTQLAFL